MILLTLKCSKTSTLNTYREDHRSSLLLLRSFSLSVVLLVGLEALVQLHDGGLDEVVAEEAVVVEEVGARLGEGGLAPLLGLTVLEHQAQLVDVVKPGGGGGNKKIININ